MKQKKPLFEWGIEKLKERMHDFDYDVEVLGKPETLEGLDCYESLSHDLEGPSDKSKDMIQAYLNDRKADGGIVVNMKSFEVSPGRFFCDLTIMPYKLKPLKTKQNTSAE